MRPQTELAKILVQYLHDQNWETFEEVRRERVIADLVARRDGEIWAIECGQQFSAKLLSQAERWKPLAHQAWIATWNCRPTPSALERVREVGAGWMLVGDGSVEVVASPVVNESPSDALGLLLFDEQRDGSHAPAGSTWGKRFDAEEAVRIRSIFERASALTKASPGILLKDISWRSTSPKELIRWVDDGALQLTVLRVFGDDALYPKPMAPDDVLEVEMADALGTWKVAVLFDFLGLYNPEFWPEYDPEKIPELERRALEKLRQLPQSDRTNKLLVRALRSVTSTQAYVRADPWRGKEHDAFSSDGYRVTSATCSRCPFRSAPVPQRARPRKYWEELPRLCEDSPWGGPAVVCRPFFEATETPVCRGARLLNLVCYVQLPDCNPLATIPDPTKL